jgi:hypothetical protein
MSENVSLLEKQKKAFSKSQTLVLCSVNLCLIICSFLGLVQGRNWEGLDASRSPSQGEEAGEKEGEERGEQA